MGDYRGDGCPTCGIREGLWSVKHHHLAVKHDGRRYVCYRTEWGWRCGACTRGVFRDGKRCRVCSAEHVVEWRREPLDWWGRPTWAGGVNGY